MTKITKILPRLLLYLLCLMKLYVPAVTVTLSDELMNDSCAWWLVRCQGREWQCRPSSPRMELVSPFVWGWLIILNKNLGLCWRAGISSEKNCALAFFAFIVMEQEFWFIPSLFHCPTFQLTTMNSMIYSRLLSLCRLDMFNRSHIIQYGHTGIVQTVSLFAGVFVSRQNGAVKLINT